MKNKNMKNHFKFLVILILGGLFMGGAWVGARKPEPISNAPYTVYINGVPFVVTSEADRQAKVDLYWKTMKEIAETSTNAKAKTAAQKEVLDLLEKGYVPNNLRKPEEKTPDTFFQNIPDKISVDPRVADIVVEKTAQHIKENLPGLGVDQDLVQKLKALDEIAEKTEKAMGIVQDVIEEKESKTLVRGVKEIAKEAGVAAQAAAVVASAIDYQEKYDDFIESGGKETDENGALTEEYLALADSAVDLVSSVSPDHLKPVFDAMKDMGAEVNKLQKGDLSKSDTLGGQAIQNIPYIEMYRNTIEAINGHFEGENEIQTTGKVTIIKAMCPLNLLITAPDGKRAGIDPKTGIILEEIPSSFVVKPTDYQNDGPLVLLPYLQNDEYKIELYGFDKGPFYLLEKTYDLENNNEVLDREFISGEIEKGKILTAGFNPYTAGSEDTSPLVFKEKKNYLSWILIGGFCFLGMFCFLVFKIIKSRIIKK